MLRHIVMFKLKATEKTLEENVREAAAKAQRLVDLVPSLAAMSVVTNSPECDSTNYDIALICDFEDKAALDAYQNHPDHKAFGAYISTVRAEGGRACIDFEI